MLALAPNLLSITVVVNGVTGAICVELVLPVTRVIQVPIGKATEALVGIRTFPVPVL
jgi:hypothetical protein